MMAPLTLVTHEPLYKFASHGSHAIQQ